MGTPLALVRNALRGAAPFATAPASCAAALFCSAATWIAFHGCCSMASLL
jgi:hypothetical protein